MKTEILVHQSRIQVDGYDYEVLVYNRPDGSYIAKTFFTSNDVIINDGISLEDVLSKHERVLPLAISSRQILTEFRSGTSN